MAAAVGAWRSLDIGAGDLTGTNTFPARTVDSTDRSILRTFRGDLMRCWVEAHYRRAVQAAALEGCRSLLRTLGCRLQVNAGQILAKLSRGACGSRFALVALASRVTPVTLCVRQPRRGTFSLRCLSQRADYRGTREMWRWRNSHRKQTWLTNRVIGMPSTPVTPAGGQLMASKRFLRWKHSRAIKKQPSERCSALERLPPLEITHYETVASPRESARRRKERIQLNRISRTALVTPWNLPALRLVKPTVQRSLKPNTQACGQRAPEVRGLNA